MPSESRARTQKVKLPRFRCRYVRGGWHVDQERWAAVVRPPTSRHWKPSGARPPEPVKRNFADLLATDDERILVWSGRA
jgi:hypothetical protein